MQFKSRKKLFLQLILIFIIVQAVGLIVVQGLIGQGIEAAIVSENPDDPLNAIALIAYILAITAVILLVIKFLKKKALGIFLKSFEILAVFTTALIVFSVFVNETAALFFAIALILARLQWKENIALRNASAGIAIVGAGAFIGIALGIIPVIIFIALLAFYDFIAVFKTKHMVVMAKAITERKLAFTLALPTKEHTFELGTGDLVIPLVFSSAALNTAALNFPFSMTPSIAVLAGSLAGLLLTINYSSKHVGKALPALPLQAVLMIACFAIAKALGF